MSPKFLSLGVVAFLAALVGCQKKTEPAVANEPPKPVTVEVVKEAERSQSFLAVNRHLELGGTLYGYIDVDGDVLKLTGSLQEFLAQMGKVQPQIAPFAKQDYGAVATTLGLTDIKAVGLSSVPDGTGFFRNRVFFYTPGERHGLLLGLGGKPGPFTHLNLAPADAVLYAEADVDVPVVYQTIKAVVAKVAGEPAGTRMEEALKKAGENAALSFLDLIYGLKGHSAMVLRIDPQQTLQIGGPSGATIPSFSLLVCVDGIAPVVERSLAQSPALKRTDEGALHVYEFKQPVLPVKEIQPVIVADGTTLYFATTRAFLDECRTQKTSLAQSPEFQKATAGVGIEGNGITYVHPRLFASLRKLQALNPNLPPQVQSTVNTVMAKLPNIDRPMVALRTNLPDGILVRSYWDRSLKQEIALMSVYPVTVGAMAAMAVPAFQKVRSASQEKAVLNNLRQLSSAADQYYLEHGTQTTSYNTLVGPEPGKYIKEIRSVAGEDYRQLRFVQGQPLRLRMPNGKVIELPQ